MQQMARAEIFARDREIEKDTGEHATVNYLQQALVDQCFVLWSPYSYTPVS